jgi:hypothetical protein
MQEREQTLQKRVEACERPLKERHLALQTLSQAKAQKLAACTTEKQRQRLEASHQKRLARAEQQAQLAEEKLLKARAAVGKLQTQMAINSEKRAWNLNTSLKSYIDPRVYHRWGQKVDYDVLERYYPTALRRKFAWVRSAASEERGASG